MSSSAALIDPTMSSESINIPDLLNEEFTPDGGETAIETILIDGPTYNEEVSADTDTTPRFADLDLPKQLLRAAGDLGFDIPTAIQAAAIPALLAGRDITGVAQTGTGKTAAFGLPLLQRLAETPSQYEACLLYTSDAADEL